jgi:glycine/D-amino acid oxidase-like deaminating enzyme
LSDVAVVGGGCTGASIAYHLAVRGARVSLYERDTLASGPTGRSTAIVRQYYSHPLLVQMAIHGLATYAHFADSVGGTSGFVRTGVLWVTDEAGRDTLERNVRGARGVGAELELLTPAQLHELDPRIALDDLVTVCYEPRGGVCDPHAATVSYARAAERLGAEIVEHAPVTSLDSVDADAIVVAAGPWSPPLLAPVGYELPIRVARAEVGRWRLPYDADPLPALADFSPLDFYFVPSGRGYLEVGTLDPSHADRPIDPDACPEGAERETLAQFRASLERRVPAARGGHWRGSWSGLYDVTPDWHPAIGRVPGSQTVYVAAGFSGHGFKLAPAVGLSIAELILDGEARTFDLAPLDPRRFARGELLEPQYGYSVIA